MQVFFLKNNIASLNVTHKYSNVNICIHPCMRVAIVGKGKRERIQGRKQAKAQKSPIFYTSAS